MSSHATYLNILETLNMAASKLDPKVDKSEKKILDSCIKAPLKVKENFEDINILLERLELDKIKSPNLILMSTLMTDLNSDLSKEMGTKVKFLKSKKDNELLISLTKIASNNGVDSRFLKNGLKVRVKVEDMGEVITVEVKSKTEAPENIVIEANAKDISSASTLVYKKVRVVALKVLKELRKRTDFIVIDQLAKYEASGDLDCQMIPALENEVYHLAPGYSSSNVKKVFSECYAHYEKEENEDRDSTLERDEGTALHTYTLENDKFDETVVEGLNLPRQKAVDKIKHEIFEMENFSKIILPTSNYEAVIRKGDFIRNNETFKMIMKSALVEYSFFLRVNGVLQKARPDILCVVTEENYDFMCTLFDEVKPSDVVFFDLKYLRSIEPTFVDSQVGNKRYDMSAKHYIDVVNTVMKDLSQKDERFAHLNVTPNFALMCMEKGFCDLFEYRCFDKEDFSTSREHLDMGLSKIRYKDEYKGYSDMPTKIKMPRYVKIKHENA